MRKLFLLGGSAVFAAAFVWLLATGHTDLQTSADSDRGTALWTVLLPLAAGTLLTRLVPPRAEPIAPSVHNGLWWLVGVAVAYPLVFVAVGDDAGVLWQVSKPVAFLLLPWLVFRVRPLLGRGVWRVDGGWRWWGPVPALLAFAVLETVLSARPSLADYPDRVVLAVAATLTFLCANIVEELFFRVALQTRLEAALGRWPAIVCSALLFAWMHLASHHQGGWGLTLAVIVAVQGSFGIFTGYLWSRYRNVYVNIAAHSISNTLPVLLMFGFA